MTLLRYTATDSPDASDLAELKASLVASNSKSAPFEMERPISVFVREHDQLIAGVSGFTYWNWLVIERLWVAESHRNQGIATRLLHDIEAEALQRECVGSWLDTFSFQAKPFSERHGYQQFGQLNDYPLGHSRHFMSKRLRDFEHG